VRRISLPVNNKISSSFFLIQKNQNPDSYRDKAAEHFKSGFLNSLQKCLWDLQDQILVEPVDTNHNAVFASDLYKLPG